MTPHLVLEGLRQTFGSHTALDGLHLELREGELVSLLGPSGCGKTTALRIVAGFQRPTAGRVLLGGRDLTRVRPSGRDMGMVFQAYSLFPHLTAAENVEFGMRVRRRGRASRRERALELLRMVGLGDAARRYPHQLSGGMQQRVALARALATEPSVLLLDEPLSALDARVRVQLREEIRRIQSDLGITTVYVTHDQEEALSTSDRVAVVADGRIEQIGPPAEIYQAPATDFVAAFIGTINRIASVVSQDAPDVVIVGGVRVPVDAARGRAPGAPVTVLVRPEALTLGPAGPGAPSGGAIPARVVAQHFLGAMTRVKALAGDSLELRADVPSGLASWLVPGTQVLASFAPGEARVLDRMPSVPS